VGIVVLNWNGRADTLRCLESVAALSYQPRFTIAVDNGSHDGSEAAIRAAFPDVTVIQTGSNLGYTGGNNAGTEHALVQGADYVLILNNDLTIAADALSCAIEAISRNDPAAGIVGFPAYRMDRPEELISWGLREAKYGPEYDKRDPAILQTCELVEVEAAYGCAMLLSRKMLATAGPFCDDFFLMHDEFELCLRARHHGFKVYAASRARVWHKVSLSFGGEASPLRMFYLHRNELLLQQRLLTMRGRADEFSAYLRDYWTRMHEEATEELRRGRFALANARLCAAYCARAGRWGKMNIPLWIRARVAAELGLAGARGLLRRTFRRVRSTGRA